MRDFGCGGAAAMVLLCSACFDEPSEASCLTIGCDAEVSSSNDPSGGSTLGPTSDGPTSAGPMSDGPTTAGPTTDVPESSGPSSSGADATADGSTSTGDVDTTAASASDVDGSSSEGGLSAVCGNGRVEIGEACDDADDDPHDGCAACELAPELVWQYEDDYDAADDRAIALASDGAAVLVGGVFGTNVTGDDGVWLRLVDGEVSPQQWRRVASLPGDNRILDLARGPNTCVIAGHVTPDGMATRAAANLVDCGTGVAGAGLPLPAADPEIAQEIRGIAIDGAGAIIVGATLVDDGGVQRGWIGVFNVLGTELQAFEWLADPTLFGEASRVNGLWLAPNDDVFVAGSYDEDGVSRGFVGRYDEGALDPIPFGDDAESSVALAVFATPTAIFAAGWMLDAGGDAAAVVEAFPMNGDELSWSLGASSDDRAFGIAGNAEGIAVTGHTGDTLATRDLFVVWLDAELVEGDRVVFDGAGGGPDGGNDILIDDDVVIVAGYTRNAATTDLLVQLWARPE